MLTDEDGAAPSPPGTPVLVVDRPRAVLGGYAAHLNGDPAADLTVIGVTGTQGKTTTTACWRPASSRPASASVVGTVGTRIRGVDVKTSLDHPEAPDLHGLFAVMREQGVVACAMEVSSHALVLGRVDGVVFDVADLPQPRSRRLRRLPPDGRGLLRRQGVALTPSGAGRD